MSSAFHVIESENQRIVDRRLTEGFGARQCLLEKRNAVREVAVQARGIVEMNNKRFVFRIAFADGRQGGRIQSLFAGFHAAAVVDHEPQTYGNVFMLEDGELLLGLVLENAEILHSETPDRMVLLISDTDMQFSEIDVHIQLECGIFLRPQKGRDEQIDKNKGPYFHDDIVKRRAL